MDARKLDWIGETVANLPPLVTVSEAISLLRLSRRHFYRLLAAGRLHAVKTADGGSSKHLIPKSSLEKYLRSLEGS